MDLTLSFEKSKFGIDEIVVVGHLCRTYEGKSNLEKVDAIARMKTCSNITEVRRFLGACVFLSNLGSSFCSPSRATI